SSAEWEPWRTVSWAHEPGRSSSAARAETGSDLFRFGLPDHHRWEISSGRELPHPNSWCLVCRKEGRRVAAGYVGIEYARSSRRREGPLSAPPLASGPLRQRIFDAV